MASGALGAAHHKAAVISILVAVTGVAIYGGINVSTTFDMTDFLPSNLEITHTLNYMMDTFNTSQLNDNYVLVEGNITSPQTLVAVKETMENMKDDTYVNYAQSTSITTLISRWEERNSTFGKMVTGNDTNGDGLPDKNIKPIYDWLYEHADGNYVLHRANGTYDSMIIIVSSTASNSDQNKVFAKQLYDDIKPLKDAGLKAIPTGTTMLTFHILDMIGGSEWDSLWIIILASLIVLTVIFFYEKRSGVLGLMTSIPVVLSLLWLLGTMYMLGISFNAVTVTITSLTIGLGITYAIHISHRFIEDWANEKNIEKAVEKTVSHTGTSIFGSAVTTMAGFGTLMASSMPPIRQFGEIATLSILYSFVLSVFILPAFLRAWASWRERRGKF
jgi:predicted RND superfamily exporter protein